MKPTKQTVYLPVKVEDELPKIRWNIIEDDGYFGDEWDNWEHMEREERFEYFKKIFSHFKFIEDGKQEGYFFTTEQLNEYTQKIIKQALETAAKNSYCMVTRVSTSPFGATRVSEVYVNKESITNTFEETFKKFEV